MHFPDVIGLTGVFITLCAYFFLQTQKIASESIVYSLSNALGSTLIICSLIYQWNLSAFIMESAWLLMSLYGLYHSFKAKQKYKLSWHGKTKTTRKEKNKEA